MMRQALSISVAAIALGTSAALAASLTERMATDRMTVVQVDRIGGRFLCAEHRRWTRVAKSDAAALGAGDIVTVHRPPSGPARVTVLRIGADELASPEQ
jgi:hypothetical protein